MLLEAVFLKVGFFGSRAAFAIELAVSLTFKTPLEELDELGVPFEGALLKKL